MKKLLMSGAAMTVAAVALVGCGSEAGSDKAAVSNKPVAATTEAPAQNVRTPEKNDRMAEDTAQGLASFTYYYFDAKNYAIQTGDADLMREVSADCASCMAEADAIEAVYADGGWIAGGQPKALNVVALEEAKGGEGNLSAVVPYMEDARTTLDKDGKTVETKEWDSDGTTLTVTANYADGGWAMVSVDETPDAGLPE
ncbi:DUF6318 family protein [Arthrobacter sp.]|uniref:DUF6318 family protein n=1 Tax=Arthrobacter sp. TaxID=1667 RepID=UPI00339501FA